MENNSIYKPIGGIESCALYPADAVEMILFSSNGCEVELSGTPLETPLLEDSSYYEEVLRLQQGVASVSHLLHLVANRNDANEWLDNDFLERAAFEGLVAIISLCDGRRLLAGYSMHLGDEQPLRLESITTSSGNSPRETPSATLRLVAYDAEFSMKLL